MNKFIAILCMLIILWGCKTLSPPQGVKTATSNYNKPLFETTNRLNFPATIKGSISKYEMRALWVASVLNLDFPSADTLTVPQQKKEFTNLLDTMVKYHFNTVVVQIRPAGDVLYPSPFEPWSQVLSGTQGKAPSPYYDPLAFMIAESHKRNIDFHAWLNPYRAVFNYKKTKIAPHHPALQYPERVVNYGQHMYYNPALAETRHFIAKIVGDLTRRYDIDAIHMDDYFYPYKIAYQDFPDETDFLRNPRGFNKNQKDEWRRDNVNLIIKELRDSIKQNKPWVQLGISPFGVWRNADKDIKGSSTKAGQTNYDDLYADILLWMRKGWIDYVTPQIYWHIGHPAADYATLVKWWNNNAYNTNLYIGHAIYKIGHSGNYLEWNTGNEITRQLDLNKKYPNIRGSMFFRSKIFENEDLKGLKDSLRKGYYRQRTLPPPAKIKTDNQAPVLDIEKLKKDEYQLSWKSYKGKGADALKYYVVYMSYENKTSRKQINFRKIIEITKKTTFKIPRNIGGKRKKRSFVITRVNRANQESSISNIIHKKL